ncbi:hypothetical protein INT47_004782 [Mucor saturninus]|uniref:Transposase n=1 Tax=Mucor saturninus TaxID=64648 RepID=A0A8H7R1Y5_9FUNG|nr:hypothetical protein INT47_004782 [Mucor saturninus]
MDDPPYLSGGGIGTNLVLLKKDERSSAQFINQVYEPVLKDFYNGSSSAILMEDNAPIHTSKVRKWKKDMECLDDDETHKTKPFAVCKKYFDITDARSK